MNERRPPDDDYYKDCPIHVGDLVKLKDETDVYVGMIVDHLPPGAKSHEPYGLFNVMWSTTAAGALNSWRGAGGEFEDHSDIDHDGWWLVEELEKLP